MRRFSTKLTVTLSTRVSTRLTMLPTSPTTGSPVSSAEPLCVVSSQATTDDSTNQRVAQLTLQVEELQRQLNQAQRMATLGELTATATHEFNNLLMTILNYSKMALRNKDEAGRDKALGRIYDSANKAARLTSNILALARNRSGEMEKTSLKQVIEDSVFLLDREFKKYRIVLDLQLDDVPEIMGQGNELQRVLINMLVNARQATAEGGSVRVSLKDCPESNEVALVIRDSGSGISPDVLPRIFEPYFSTKSGPDATGRGGTGVGLACCKKIIDAHRGRIRVESTVGKGTAFTIRLPKS
jgi:two-component system, NtrC family, sensor kinase